MQIEWNHRPSSAFIAITSSDDTPWPNYWLNLDFMSSYYAPLSNVYPLIFAVDSSMALSIFVFCFLAPSASFNSTYVFTTAPSSELYFLNLSAIFFNNIEGFDDLAAAWTSCFFAMYSLLKLLRLIWFNLIAFFNTLEIFLAIL